MAEVNRSQSDVSSFFDRIKGQDRLRKSDSLIVLNTPQNDRERQVKQKITSIVQYVRNKTWSRRHVEFFEEYRRMVATFPIIKAGIDIYAEEIVSKNSDGAIFSIKCDNKHVKDLLEECYFKNLALNAKAYKTARQMCQFGNAYAYLVTRPKDGVTDMIFLPPEAMIREHMYDPSNLENYRFTWYGAGGGALFEPWEIVHWKNGEDIEMEPYGSSILRPIVDTWRRVVLIREALVIYRITRAPSKLLFKIGTDGLTGTEAFQFAQEMKKEIQKKPLTNPQTGEIDFKYNPMPLSINTLIPLLDGRELSLGELIEEYEEGKVNYVYSIQDNTHQIVAGKVKWCGKNYTANKLIRVWLDNESYIDSAPEHPFILRDGSKKRADELKEFDSLMPFYKRKEVLYKKTEYEQVYNPATGVYEFTHKLISNEVSNPKNHKTRHHKDFNRFNNTPENLEWVNFQENEEITQEVLTCLVFNSINKEKTKVNHKVSRIEILENISEDVCCMTIVGLNDEDDRHNFATTNVFVGNSIEENFFMPVYEGSPSDVQVLEGAGNLDAVEDYKIIKDDLFAGLKIPKSWLTFEEDLSNKAALGEEDIRFAKTVQRLQSEFVEGLLHIGVVHLFLKGCSQEEMESFSIEMNNPSIASEKRKLELVEARLNIAKAAWDSQNAGLNIMSYVDVCKTILKFSDAEIEATIKAQFNEKKIAWRLEQLRTTGTYAEPDIEKKLAQMRGLTGEPEGKTPTGFDGLTFEGDQLTEVMRKRIDKEISEIVSPVVGKVNAKMIRTLTEGNNELMKNLKKARKDFGMSEKKK
jgi:hypothetical protein